MFEAMQMEKVRQQGPLAIPKKAPVFRDFKERFLGYVRNSHLDPDTKRYYETGCRMLMQTPISGMRLDIIRTSDAETLQFSGGASTANCGLRTLRRMLSLAVEWNVVYIAPKVKLRKEY